MIVKEGLLPIEEVAAKLGLDRDRLYLYGPHMAKVLGEPPKPKGRLVLVTAITPTPAGEGKSTTAIGLVDALWRLGKRAALALREPSLGPVFGVKGGATGGGRARVEPRHEINLHFTGDFHAVTSAVNLLNALLDNHLHQGNELGIDPRRIELKRAIDMNDRALRHIVLGLGGKAHGVPREGGFELTVASEVMALMSLARDFQDLKRRLGRMRVAFTHEGKPVYAEDLMAVGAMAALLRQAFLPNLVQTAEGNPAFIHMGPFGNIAHGTNSLRASLFALGLADLVVQEAGFATDLGLEKFMNVVARTTGLVPEAVVLVATLRALRYHGGQDAYGMPDPKAVKAGLANLEKHVENVELFGYKPVIALNRFPGDTPEEIALVRAFAEERGLPFALSEVYAQGGRRGPGARRAGPGGPGPAPRLPAPLPPRGPPGGEGGGHRHPGLRGGRGGVERGGQEGPQGRQEGGVRGLARGRGQGRHLPLRQPQAPGQAPGLHRAGYGPPLPPGGGVCGGLHGRDRDPSRPPQDPPGLRD